MKRIIDILFSSKLTVILLILFGIALGLATFIEDKYDTSTAKILIYNSKWLEFVFLLMIINFIGHVKKYNFLKKEKLAGFLFHLSLIVMILGAAITRYFGFDGSMHIREGESANVMYTTEAYFQVSKAGKDGDYVYEKPMMFSQLADNSINIDIPNEEKGDINVTLDSIIKNPVEVIKENVTDGVNIIELMVFTKNGQERRLIENGETTNIDGTSISFNNSKNSESFNITDKNGVINFVAPFDVVVASMQSGATQDTVAVDTIAELQQGYAYKALNSSFVFSNYYKKAKKILVSGGAEAEEKGPDALILAVTIDGKKHTANVFGGSDYYANFQEFNFDGTKISFSFGNKKIELPFSLQLNKFELERYPGSMSPSSFASEVTLIDNRSNLKEDHRIFMNNVLDYDQYRFFQSSYDKDEKGTILSVNHDFWGTWISYFGYALLSLGFVVTFFNKKSRFLTLRRNIIEIRNKRKTSLLTIAFIIMFSSLSFSQTTPSAPVNDESAEKFGQLLVQTYDGRFTPLSSLTYDILHKISRKDKFEIEGKGEMDAVKVVIDMLINPEFWKEQKVIYIREKSVKDVIGITDGYASFSDFFEKDGTYKLQKLGEEAFRKKQQEQNRFDKEIIKVDERLNIFMMVLNGSILKIFPEQESPENKWISWDEPAAVAPLPDMFKVINDDLKLNDFNYASILGAYLTEVKKGNNARADEILGYIVKIQRSGAIADQLPSETKINVEIFYNKAQIFIFLKNLYAGLSVILLLLAFIDNLRTKKSKILTYALNFLIGVLALAFIYHTVGLGLRWYLTGHAPWANGYETLLLVGWGALLAGFSFVRYSKITLAATALLAFFVLMTASHSSYDPQLTNLQPVLKSYWLIIHVATLTISYGFLGLGFMLGIMNLLIMFFKSKKNSERLDVIVTELTLINEMNIAVGIVLATIGTFLGGVWANESWGRYWGWDAKETWALIIVIAYTIVLHLRLVPSLKSKYIFNVASIIAFGSVVMTFVGVNYYLSKGMHSYGQGDTPIFPLWAWGLILATILLIVLAGIREKYSKK
jgi:cytochrome c-type biogenesis protein CcsB